jgi:hypothetical protein
VGIKLTGATAVYINTGVFDYNAPYTFMLWVKIESMGAVGAYFPHIDDTTANNIDRQSLNATTHRLTVLNAGINQGTTIAHVNTDNTWYHRAMVRASATDIKIYADGVYSAAPPQNVAARPVANRIRITSTGALLHVAYARAWTAALSQAEMELEKFSDIPVRTANLWGDWKLLNAADMTDYSGNGHTFIQEGIVQSGDNPPVEITPEGPTYVTLHGARPVGYYVDEDNCVLGWAVLVKDITP